jgi:hypothetical protein
VVFDDRQTPGQETLAARRGLSSCISRAPFSSSPESIVAVEIVIDRVWRHPVLIRGLDRVRGFVLHGLVPLGLDVAAIFVRFVVGRPA